MVFKRNISIIRSSAFVGLLAVGALAACKDSTSPGTKRAVKLSFSSQAARASLASLSASGSVVVGPDGASRDVTVGTPPDLVIAKAQIVIDQIELSPSEDVNCNGKGENGCEELDHDPVLVDLPVVAGTKAMFSVPIADGTYSELEAEIQPAERGIPGRPEFNGKSVRVEGTYKGAPFVYFANVKADFKMKLSPPLVINSASKNITINVDLSKWFLGTDGKAIDPASAGVGGSNAAAVVGNIKASLKSFRDDDESGEDKKG